MRPAPTRPLGLLLAALLLPSCDEPLRLIVVERAPSGGAGSAGATFQAGSSAGGGRGGSDGGRAGAPTAGTASGVGASAGESPVVEAGAGGVGGAGEPSPWDAPALYSASFSSHAFPGQYIRHLDDKGFIAAIDIASTAEREAATFEMIPGPYDETCLTFRAVDLAGRFFRHADSRIQLHAVPPEDAAEDVKTLFKADATFCILAGFADPEGVTFRASNYADRVLHLRNGNELWIDDIVAGDSLFASESTFYVEPALAGAQ